MLRIASGSVTSAITLSVPLHRGQIEISIAKTRLSRSAQLNGAVGKFLSKPDSVGIDVAGFLRFFCAGYEEPATTALLNREFGAKTP